VSDNKTNTTTRTKGFSTNGLNQLGKLPPQNIMMEEAVIGALMIEKEAIRLVEDILRADSFYKTEHKEIYKAILELSAESQPIDMLTVSQQLRRNGTIELVGGTQQIVRLTSFVNSAANIEEHARIIMEMAIKRELITIANEIQKEAYEDRNDVFDLLDQAEQKLFAISENNLSRKTQEMRTIMQETISQIEQRKNSRFGLTGVPSGFTELDRITSGWQKSDLIIVAGRTSMGKTAFSLSIIRNAAVDFDIPVAIFSLEMSATQLASRLISIEAELESEKLKKGNLADYEWQQLYTRCSRLSNAKIFIDDTPAISILDLRAKARRLKEQHKIELLIVDYLQIMSGNNSGKNLPGNREQEVALITRSLKNLARELNIPVIALSQLSRAVETRGGDKRPQLSDLRESGSIEQDSDIVLLLYRPEKYGITQDSAGNSTLGLGEVIIAKHRNGPLGEVVLRYIDKFTKFANLENESFNMMNDGLQRINTFDKENSIELNSKINSLPSNGHDDVPF